MQTAQVRPVGLAAVLRGISFSRVRVYVMQCPLMSCHIMSCMPWPVVQCHVMCSAVQYTVVMAYPSENTFKAKVKPRPSSVFAYSLKI